ncbi:hypothetical protein HOLleu_27425 [Holothuria leucospilota]|uniref:Uncharacterized protein n=1 Tax=Holothuria leucospilota TaxID=206669 RepID=A0A9Q1H2B4_HOLLE|nr:hypothetical protein HOLleu_27425 [Holothuria leucospilota]
MEITTEGSGVSSQGSSSNEYFTADEVWMDLETGQGSRERDEPRIRVLGIMDAIRNGLYATFDRSPKNKSVKKGPGSSVTAMSPGGVSDTDALFDHPQVNLPFDHGSRLDSNGLMVISKESSDSVKNLRQNIKDNVGRRSKQDLYDIRPVFGVDTRTFAARSSSEHAMVTKDSRGKARNRRQRMTWPIKPCESDSSERMAINTKKNFAFKRNESVDGLFHDALMRKKSKVLVSDAVRKALSVVTVENVLQDSLLSYTDLQRGDIRLTSDLVFWTEDVGTSFTGDATAETEKSEFVLTPYPKSTQQDCIRENSQSDAQICELPKCELDDDSDEDVHKFESYEDCEDEQFFDSSGLFPEDYPRTRQACNKEDDTSDGQNSDEGVLSKGDVFCEQSLHQETGVKGAEDDVTSSSFQMQSDPDYVCGVPAGTSIVECDDDESNNHIGELRTKFIDTSDTSPGECKEDCDSSNGFFGDDVFIAKDGCCSKMGEFSREPCFRNDEMSGAGTVLKENLPSAKYHKEEIEAAEEIVRDTMKVARSVAHHVYPKHEYKDQLLSEPQCWEDLLDLDEDDDVISLSDFDMKEIKFIRNELAEMRNTIGEVAQEIIKEKKDNCDSGNEIVSSQGSNNIHQRDQQLEPKEEEEELDNSVEGMDDIRTKITFWEGFMKFGYDVTDKKVPSVAEKADRLVSCKFCNQGHQLKTGGELNDPSRNYSESWDNGRIVAVETSISNVSEGLSYHDARKENDEIQKKTAQVSYQEPVIPEESRLVNTKSPRKNLPEVKEGEAEEESALPKVKTRISIWEKLPFRKRQLKEKTEESVDLDTSTKEKVAFFEQMSTPQSPFSRRSSSRFSFMKDDWLQRFQRKHDVSTTTDTSTFEDSSFIQQPGGSYDSGIWTNAAFFENSLLESIDDAMREKAKEEMDQENSLGDVHVGEDNLESSKEKAFESPCHSDDNDESEWVFVETEKTKSMLAPLPEQSHHIKHAVSPEEAETIMDSKGNLPMSVCSLKDINNEKSSQGNVSYYSAKEESNGTSHLSDGHEFFLEMIGEHPVDVAEDTMSCDEQEEDGSFLEVVGSAMKLHEVPNLENKVDDSRSDAKRDINLKKKKNLLAFFSHRKNMKKDAVASKSVKKCKVEARDEGNLLYDIDRKIAKKCKKKRSKDWGYVDIDPNGASTGQSKPKKRWKLFRKSYVNFVTSN